MDEERWRVFCAVELPSEVRERAARHIELLRDVVPEARASWPRSENLHLTLKFVGEVSRSRVDQLSRAAERATDTQAPFSLTLEGAGAFPPHGLPKILWLGVSDRTRSLSHIQTALENECATVGFSREDRPFRPHLTLARIRSPHGARSLARAHGETGFEPFKFDVREIVVMRSELGPVGSRYTGISRHALG